MSDEKRSRAARERARKRRDWPVRVFRLGMEPGDDLSASTTVDERLAMMWPLAVEAWALSGRTLPVYARKNIPGRLIEMYRQNDVPPDDSASS